jgi:hypothetical protein
VHTPDKTRGATIELRSIRNEMHAFVYRLGARIGYRKLADRTEVWRVSNADKIHIPKNVPRFSADVKNAPEFSGWYDVPGEGPAAIFGAKPQPELVSATLSSSKRDQQEFPG